MNIYVYYIYMYTEYIQYVSLYINMSDESSNIDFAL
jgi:hypothetical protein